MNADFLLSIAAQLERLLRPLDCALNSPQDFVSLVERYGWKVDPASVDIAQVRDALGISKDLNEARRLFGVVHGMASGPRSLQSYADLVAVLRHVLARLRDIETGPMPPAMVQYPWAAGFLRDLPAGLLVDYLKNYKPLFLALLLVLGVVEEERVDTGGAPNRIVFMRYRVAWSRMANVAADPLGRLKERFAWNDSRPWDYDSALSLLLHCAEALGLSATMRVPSPRRTKKYYDPTNPALALLRELRLTLAEDATSTGEPVVVALSVLPVPPSRSPGARPAGFAVVPSVTLPNDGLFRAILPFSVELAGAFQADEAVILEVYPALVRLVPRWPEAAGFDASVSLIFEPLHPRILLGTDTSHRLQMFRTRTRLRFVGARDEPDVELEIALEQVQIVLDFSEGDGFLQQIVGSETQRVDFDAALLWSWTRGLRFRGQAGLRLLVPLHKTIGGVALERLSVSLHATQEGLRLAIGLSGTTSLGPVAATIENVGIELALIPVSPGMPAGLLGDLDLRFDFKPPHGIGLSVDATSVVGGGYLFFDAQKEQYAGVLQLEVAKTISVKAIGLLTTRMPDGSSGFSLLVIITAQGFAPIQLGFGFTLTGIGGLLGVNRTAAVEVLRSGIKTGTLGSILFPADPVRNAPRIVSDVGTVFPPAPNRYVFGPMAVIEWGTPPILKMEIGLVLELPDPVRLLILGRLKATLPDEKNALVQIRMDALGVIDFARSLLSLDATLYDSRLLSFVLTGDMAMRLNWGSDPSFLLAIGGWNPRFPAPAGFPLLSRLMLTLAGNDNARLRFESYLAVTSNTVQFGARVDFYFALQPFSVEGFLAFDTLFSFSPFSFIADLGASAALQMNGTTLLSVGLNLTLSGPSPWRVRGTAEFSLLSFKQSIPFNVQLGPDRQPELAPAAVDVKGLLTAALSDARNWSSELPDGERPLVTFRPFAATGNVLRVHPLAEVAVRERVVPLDRTISKFGNAPVSGERMFSLKAVRSDDGREISVQNISDSFALAQFANMSDDKKLSSPSFVKEHAGIRFTTGELAYGYEPGLDAVIVYETLMIAPAGPAQPLQPYEMPAAVLDGTATLGAAALAATRRPGGTGLRMA